MQQNDSLVNGYRRHYRWQCYYSRPSLQLLSVAARSITARWRAQTASFPTSLVCLSHVASPMMVQEANKGARMWHKSTERTHDALRQTVWCDYTGIFPRTRATQPRPGSSLSFRPRGHGARLSGTLGRYTCHPQIACAAAWSLRSHRGAVAGGDPERVQRMRMMEERQRLLNTGCPAAGRSCGRSSRLAKPEGSESSPNLVRPHAQAPVQAPVQLPSLSTGLRTRLWVPNNELLLASPAFPAHRALPLGTAQLRVTAKRAGTSPVNTVVSETIMETQVHFQSSH